VIYCHLLLSKHLSLEFYRHTCKRKLLCLMSVCLSG
jgi:hypothetical protein